MTYNWNPETESLLTTLQKHGLTIVSVHNGEEETKFDAVSLERFVEQCHCCEESRLYVKNKEGKLKGLFLVYGNAPGELVCDYHVDPQLDAATDEHYNLWEGKPQPVKL